MSEAEVLYSVDNHVATITLNRPKTLNAFTGDNIKEMQDLMDKATNDRDVGVIVLTGSGERAFCVGGDINWEKGNDDGTFRPGSLSSCRCKTKPLITSSMHSCHPANVSEKLSSWSSRTRAEAKP